MVWPIGLADAPTGTAGAYGSRPTGPMGSARVMGWSPPVPGQSAPLAVRPADLLAGGPGRTAELIRTSYTGMVRIA
jgi:hypothetical protein